jgi:hypothetical protein
MISKNKLMMRIVQLEADDIKQTGENNLVYNEIQGNKHAILSIKQQIDALCRYLKINMRAVLPTENICYICVKKDIIKKRNKK